MYTYIIYSYIYRERERIKTFDSSYDCFWPCCDWVANALRTIHARTVPTSPNVLKHLQICSNPTLGQRQPCLLARPSWAAWRAPPAGCPLRFVSPRLYTMSFRLVYA